MLTDRIKIEAAAWAAVIPEAEAAPVRREAAWAAVILPGEAAFRVAAGEAFRVAAEGVDVKS